MPDDFLHQRTHINGCHAAFFGRDCDCPPMRTYVAVDALLSDEAVTAAARAIAATASESSFASADEEFRAGLRAALAIASSEERGQDA